jgi:hypothetical protein
MVFSAIKEAWNFVDKPLRKLFSILLGVRFVTNFFDLAGTALMAVLVGYVVGVLSGNPQTVGIQPVINFFNLEELAIRNQVIVLGVITLSVFVLKPIIVLPISRILSFKIHKQGANLTNALITDFTRLPLSAIKKWSSPDVNYATTSGLPTVLTLLWTSVALISDIVLILMFFITLFITNPLITSRFDFK